MSDKIGSSFILEPEQRVKNIQSAYSYIEAASTESIKFEDFITGFHAKALSNWDLSKLNRFAVSNEKGRIDMQDASPGYYRDDESFGFTSLDINDVEFYAPNSKDIPILIGELSSKYEELLDQLKTSPDTTVTDARKLALWAMTNIVILHPFYEGNGRTARSLLPYTLKRLGYESQFIENLEKKPITELDDLIINEVKSLYESGEIYSKEFAEGGFNSVLETIASTPPTREFVETHQMLLGGAILRSINKTNIDSIKQSKNFDKVLPIIRDLPTSM